MTTSTQVKTLGPVDPNAPWIAKVYSVVGSIGTIAGSLQTFHLITAEQSASIHTVGADLITLVLSVVALIAGFRTHKQVKNGTFDAAPEPQTVEVPVHLPPLPIPAEDKVEQGLTELKQAADSAMNAWTTATDKVTSVLGIPVPDAVDVVEAAITKAAGLK